MSNQLAILLADMKEDETLAYVQQELESGTDASELLEGAKEGMNIVGQKFADSEYFIPDLIYSGVILKNIISLLEPHLKKSVGSEKSLGKAAIGTVQGDIHNIGKDLVAFMLEVAGFEVIDLGVDVPPQKFVDTIKETGCQIVGLSGFLTLAFDSMKNTIDAIETAGLRNQVKIMIGGGQMDERIKEYTGANAYGTSAMDAVNLAKEWIGG